MLLVIKLLLIPTLVAGVTVAARRWGLRIGGLLTALPIVGGPTLCFYAIERGSDFAAIASRATLLGIVATGIFCAVYAQIAIRANWLLSLIAGWSAFAVIATIMYGVELGTSGDLALALVSLLVAERLLPSPTVRPSTERSGWDLPLRMIAATALVLVLTSLAGLLGPQLSGILTAFPIATVVICVFTHKHDGPEAVASFFRGLLRGLHSYAVFCFVFSVALGALQLRLVPSVGLALVFQCSVQGFLLWRVFRQITTRKEDGVREVGPRGTSVIGEGREFP
jgi:hypothetical protein